MNALDSGGFEDAELVAHPTVDQVLVPMVETEREAWHTAEVIRRFEDRHDVQPASLFVVVETARGIANVDEIATAHEKIDVLSFGLADYATDADVQESAERTEVIYQRSVVANAAAHAGVQAFDFATLETSDMNRVREDATAARRMGYTGKAAIHPDQLTPIHDVFTPAPDEVERAREIIDAYEEAGEPGVLTVDGEMVDKPVVERARRTLELADEFDGSD
jgi:citrate lyase beta subunit